MNSVSGWKTKAGGYLITAAGGLASIAQLMVGAGVGAEYLPVVNALALFLGSLGGALGAVGLGHKIEKAGITSSVGALLSAGALEQWVSDVRPPRVERVPAPATSDQAVATLSAQVREMARQMAEMKRASAAEGRQGP
jgi:hypothetical protein